ncbi:MAG: hypothetical protein Q9166_005673 [cf. Caloplaca sp. 2 TL-2023]
MTLPTFRFGPSLGLASAKSSKYSGGLAICIQRLPRARPSDAYLTRRSLVQHEIIFGGEGLTLLSVDHIYTFKQQLLTLSNTDLFDVDYQKHMRSCVQLLRRIDNTYRGVKLSKSYLVRAYNIDLPHSILREVCKAYSLEYGENGVRGVSLEADQSIPQLPELESPIDSHPTYPLPEIESPTDPQSMGHLRKVHFSTPAAEFSTPIPDIESPSIEAGDIDMGSPSDYLKIGATYPKVPSPIRAPYSSPSNSDLSVVTTTICSRCLVTIEEPVVSYGQEMTMLMGSEWENFRPTMQSGISASPNLQTTFRTFLTDPSLFALLITIISERLELLETLPTSSHSPSDFHTSLPILTPHLTPTRALYILLRRHPSPHPSPLVCITYVPDAAPVRQKTLFASTRLTLIRELGAELFGETMFATEKGDLSAEGWEKWERHLKGDGDEREEVREALGALREGGAGGLVMLWATWQRVDESENIALAGVEDSDVQKLATTISDTEPRYSFFRYSHGVDGQPTSSIVFIYTCPSGSKVKERMIYASFKKVVMDTASKEAGIEIAKKVHVL